MFTYLETYLGESTKAAWERYKVDFQDDYQYTLQLGNNPYNFIHKIHTLLTGRDPNSQSMRFQVKAVEHLEQLSIKKMEIYKTISK
jgi:hypothetical protein